MTKRIFDITLALVLLPIVGPIVAMVALAVVVTSPGPALHWSKRVGKDRTLFLMAKMRTMRTDTPQLATHLMDEPEKFLTPIGRFLRASSLDELPQLYNIVRGEMSFVGPRPALFNQDDLVALREEKGINALTPGVTGWAQINGRDEISIKEKVNLEEYYLERKSLWFDIKILFLTLIKAGGGEGVSH